MTLERKYEVERTKWDALAHAEIPSFKLLKPEDDFHRYAKRTNTMRGVSEFLGDLRGKHVLEYGCGLGELSVRLAKSGARVTCFDLSANSVAITRQRARLNGVEDQVTYTVAAGESLPYADETFDIVFGKAILHHLEVNHGWRDLHRVLKVGGKAAFIEPMGMNPILNFVRAFVPYPHKNPRGADRPVNYEEIRAWGRPFRRFYFREIQLLSMLERGLGFGRRLTLLRRMDDMLLTLAPPLRRYCRYVGMFMVK